MGNKKSGLQVPPPALFEQEGEGGKWLSSLLLSVLSGLDESTSLISIMLYTIKGSQRIDSHTLTTPHYRVQLDNTYEASDHW